MASLALLVMTFLGEQTGWTLYLKVGSTEGLHQDQYRRGAAEDDQRTAVGSAVGGSNCASSTSERVSPDRLAAEVASADNGQAHVDARCLPCRTGRVLTSHALSGCPRQGIAFLRSSLSLHLRDQLMKASTGWRAAPRTAEAGAFADTTISDGRKIAAISHGRSAVLASARCLCENARQSTAAGWTAASSFR